MIEDTGLITRNEADALWAKHKATVRECVENKTEFEAALWINMHSNTNYFENAFHVRNEDCAVRYGRLCQLVSL